MEIFLKYGQTKLHLKIPDKADVTVLRPSTLPIVENIPAVLRQSFAQPLNSGSISDLIRRIAPKSIAIAVPDETRPAPLDTILPVLFDDIKRAAPDLDSSNISIVVGGGLHPPLDEQTLRRMIPSQLLSQCGLVAHDAHASSMTDFGLTSRGTPLRVNALFAEADLKIVIGQIDPHQFVGFTGGSKGVVIGLASAETIERNHGLMFSSDAQVGRLSGNPVREDMNEAGRMVGIHFAINLILDTEKQPVGILTGDPEAVLATGADICKSIYGVTISEKFDIVMASCGGHPRDICLYQAQKGLNLASHALKPGGKILLLAACPQGVGDDVYYDYVCRFREPQEVLEDFRSHKFKMGAHKAYLFGRTLTGFDVAIASELEKATLDNCLLRQADPQTQLTQWIEEFDGRPKVAVVPNANTTFFIFKPF